jgi:hypothetical protein
MTQHLRESHLHTRRRENLTSQHSLLQPTSAAPSKALGLSRDFANSRVFHERSPRG